MKQTTRAAVPSGDDYWLTDSPTAKPRRAASFDMRKGRQLLGFGDDGEPQWLDPEARVWIDDEGERASKDDMLTATCRTLVEDAARTPSGAKILMECLEVAEVLLQKNAAYGDSALDPVRIFSNAPVEEQILVRIDDKLSRRARGHAAGEDVELDLMGYLVLLRIARKNSS